MATFKQQWSWRRNCTKWRLWGAAAIILSAVKEDVMTIEERMELTAAYARLRGVLLKWGRRNAESQSKYIKLLEKIHGEEG